MYECLNLKVLIVPDKKVHVCLIVLAFLIHSAVAKPVREIAVDHFSFICIKTEIVYKTSFQGFNFTQIAIVKNRAFSLKISKAHESDSIRMEDIVVKFLIVALPSIG